MEKESKSTPGPWKMYENYTYVAVGSAKENILTFKLNRNVPEYCQRQLANAELIARAPELLEQVASLQDENESHKLIFKNQAIAWEDKVKDKDDEIRVLKLWKENALRTLEEDGILVGKLRKEQDEQLLNFIRWSYKTKEDEDYAKRILAKYKESLLSKFPEVNDQHEHLE